MKKMFLNWLYYVGSIYIITLIFAPNISKYFLVLGVIALIFMVIVNLVFARFFYNSSADHVNAKFVKNRYKLENKKCIVQYNPDRKIIISENLTSEQKREKRIFTIDKSDGADVSHCWYLICKMFDEYLDIDLLYAYFKKKYDIKLQFVSTLPEVKTVDITIQPPKSQAQEFFDINNIQKDSYKLDTPVENIDSEFVEMDEIAPASLIDINSASASQIASLPGINIVIAKKIVEFRNKNGEFKSEDEFLEIAQVKEIFIPKIRKKIQILKPKTTKKQKPNKGRIVDI